MSIAKVSLKFASVDFCFLESLDEISEKTACEDRVAVFKTCWHNVVQKHERTLCIAVISIELIRLCRGDGIFTHTLVARSRWAFPRVSDVNQIIPVHVIVAALENGAESLTATCEFDLHICDDRCFAVFKRDPLWIPRI